MIVCGSVDLWVCLCLCLCLCVCWFVCLNVWMLGCLGAHVCVFAVGVSCAGVCELCDFVFGVFKG